MALDNTTADAILKEVYEDVLEDLSYKNRPFLSMVPKGQWKGDTHVVAVLGENSIAGVGNSFPNAINNKGNSLLNKFSVTLKEVHAIGSISDVTMEVSKDKEGAFAEAAKLEMESGMNGIMNKLAAQVWRTGSGSIGQVGTVTSTALTLKDPEDVVNFGKGMFLDGDTVDGGATSHAGDTSSSTSALTAIEPITDVNRSTGVLTGADWTDITGLAADDYVFQAGDYGKAITGVGGWIPASDPGSTAFFGLDRTADLTRYSGVRVSASEVSGLPIEEKLQHLLSRIGREGGEPDCIFMNYANLRNLEISLADRVQYVDSDVVVGFKTIVLSCPTGLVKVYADRWCPNNRAYALQMNDWKLLSTTGGMPALNDRDGNGLLREATANNFEFRIRFYGNLICRAPGHQGVIDLS